MQLPIFLTNKNILIFFIKLDIYTLYVPTFPNSADIQIIIQACLLATTTQTKEIIIVSNDHIFSHLRSHLSSLGVQLRILKTKQKEASLKQAAKDTLEKSTSKTGKKTAAKKTNKKATDKQATDKQSLKNKFDNKLLEIIKSIADSKQKVTLCELNSEFHKRYKQILGEEFKKTCSNGSNVRLITYLKNHELIAVERKKEKYFLQLKSS